MDAALIVLAVGILFGGMVLMLVMGYQSTERERALQAGARETAAAAPPASVVTVPGFFANPAAASQPFNILFDDALVNRIEHHVRLEQAVVAQFVHHPSIDNLYRESGASVHIH